MVPLKNQKDKHKEHMILNPIVKEKVTEKLMTRLHLLTQQHMGGLLEDHK